MKTKKTPIHRLLELGLSRKDITFKTTVSPQMISMISRGKRSASLKTRRLFWDAFRISPWEWDK